MRFSVLFSYTGCFLFENETHTTQYHTIWAKRYWSATRKVILKLTEEKKMFWRCLVRYLGLCFGLVWFFLIILLHWCSQVFFFLSPEREKWNVCSVAIDPTAGVFPAGLLYAGGVIRLGLNSGWSWEEDRLRAEVAVSYERREKQKDQGRRGNRETEYLASVWSFLWAFSCPSIYFPNPHPPFPFKSSKAGQG